MRDPEVALAWLMLVLGSVLGIMLLGALALRITLSLQRLHDEQECMASWHVVVENQSGWHCATRTPEKP